MSFPSFLPMIDVSDAAGATRATKIKERSNVARMAFTPEV
jgi:hypothetical protein